MKILINITSYNRKSMLLRLIAQLKGCDVVVWDDHSNFNLKGNFTFYKFSKNFGKKYCWQKFNLIFNAIKTHFSTYDYYIFLPDDVTLIDKFVEKSIKTFEEIEDENKICLSLLTDNRVKKENWNSTLPIEVGNVILTGWNDLCFICEKRFFVELGELDLINLKRWEQNENLGSGVGSQISRKLRAKKLNMYHVKDTFVLSKKHKSKMNP